MRIKVRQFQECLSVLAEDSALTESVKPLADQLDKIIENQELSPEDVLLVIE